MSALTKQEVLDAAKFARLLLTEEETELFSKQLSAVVEMTKKLAEVNTEQVEPTIQVFDLRNVYRKDEIHPSLPIEEVLLNTKEHQDNQVKVPHTISEA